MTSTEPLIRLAEDDRDRAAVFVIRGAVFVIRGAVFVSEQQVPIEEEWDERDVTADHLLALVDDVPVGTVRLVDQGGGVGVLGRLAVLPKGRGAGTGVALVRAVEDRARERGLTTVELHAQTHALGFYERLGYTAHGEEFLDAGIPHLHMARDVG
ncbi:GNAT family N-acetyltransferase [Nocardiopsis sp. CNR-923]|uniref:GNAT family N-acetyltransferase n=1 Tax=Nocardiopsis sp. CNR-923 TaxID=1904965 RepID=UPI00095EE48D|nr:GNAT family N-acetyltransferase [Nocardiopsis sp. CNR-923]OLT29121.1 GNAT family N-acetyltransferase [Nocardiopsis sp. CNR-923]